MEEKKIRKYNSEFRKNLKLKISKLNNKTCYLEIYKIINYELDNKFSINSNGVYFNLNGLSDSSIDLILNAINYKNESETLTETFKIKYECYNKDNSIENFILDQKLTNQEKSLIKKYRINNLV